MSDEYESFQNSRKAINYLMQKLNESSRKGLFGFSIDLKDIPPLYYWNQDNIDILLNKYHQLGMGNKIIF